jgi:hypothetical protein
VTYAARILAYDVNVIALYSIFEQTPSASPASVAA